MDKQDKKDLEELIEAIVNEHVAKDLSLPDMSILNKYGIFAGLADLVFDRIIRRHLDKVFNESKKEESQ